MMARPSARLIVLDGSGRVLLFRFVFRRGPLAGQNYWATPGGRVEPGESFEQAAIRELFEETGKVATALAPAVAERTFPLRLSSGEWVSAEEQFFVVSAADDSVSRAGWTEEEREVMAEHRWWTADEIAASTETIFPEDILAMVPHSVEGTPHAAP